MENFRLFNEDAINGMKGLISQNIKVDCIITDPPYKLTSKGSTGTMGWELPKPESKKYIMMPTMVKRLCRSCFGWSYHGRKMGCNECADTGYVMRKEVEKIYIEEE